MKILIIWPVLCLLRVVMIVAGLVVVPIALPFRKERDSYRMPTWKGWRLVCLPRWAWFWDNRRDGCLGDIHGKYHNVQRPEWTAGNDYLMAWWWLAIRNPCNNFSRFTPFIAVDMRKNTAVTLYGQDVVKDRPGMEGWQFVKAGNWYYGFYLVKRMGSRFFVIRMGHKMDVQDNGVQWADDTAPWKGFTFRFAFERVE